MKESVIQRRIMLALGKRPECMVQRINSGLLADPHTGQRRIRTAPEGIPDLMVMIPGNRVVWIETKSRTGRPSRSQKRWAAAAKQRGHDVHYCRTVDQAVAAVDAALGTAIPTTTGDRTMGLFTEFDGRRFDIEGTDTSGHQKAKYLDLETLHGSGQMFHIVKVSEDDYYTFRGAADRLERARELGALVGEYHFFRPEDGWADDLSFYLRRSLYQPGDLAPMNDFEKGRRQGTKDHPKPGNRADHNHNVEGAIRFAEGVLPVLGDVDKLLLYLTKPSWDWYARRADDRWLARLPELYDLVWAEYTRDEDGKLDGNPDLLDGFAFPKLRRAIKQRLPFDAPVIHQWTGQGELPGFTQPRQTIDRCLMAPEYWQQYRDFVCE